jgi:hypothetical protein
MPLPLYPYSILFLKKGKVYLVTELIEGGEVTLTLTETLTLTLTLKVSLTLKIFLTLKRTLSLESPYKDL